MMSYNYEVLPDQDMQPCDYEIVKDCEAQPCGDPARNKVYLTSRNYSHKYICDKHLHSLNAKLRKVY